MPIAKMATASLQPFLQSSTRFTIKRKLMDRSLFGINQCQVVAKENHLSLEVSLKVFIIIMTRSTIATLLTTIL